MAALTITDRNNAGTTYGAAADAFVTALVDLCAKETILDNRGAQLDGGAFRAVIGAMSLLEFRHGKFSSASFGAATVSQLVATQVKSLLGAGG